MTAAGAPVCHGRRVLAVNPAEAGIHGFPLEPALWVPAFAGTTGEARAAEKERLSVCFANTFKFAALAACVCLALFFTAIAAFGQSNPVPFVNQPVVPSAVAPGGPSFTLTVNGTGFVSGATVNWNGAPLTTTFVSSSRLTATVPAANTATLGTARVRVTNPGSSVASIVAYLAVSPTVSSVAVAQAPGSPTALGLFFANMIVRGDFYGDGRLDMAIASSDTSGVIILLGNGDGTFTQSTTPIPAGDAPPFLA